MTDTCHAATSEYAYTVADLELFVRRLCDGDQPAIIELDSNLQAGLTGQLLFSGRAEQTASHHAKYRANRTAFTATDIAASDAANHRASRRADRRLGAFDLHAAHAFNGGHLYGLGLPCLIPAITTTG